MILKFLFPELNKKLDRISEALLFIINQNKSIMTKQERLNAQLDRLNEVTNDIAADLEQAIEDLEAGTVSDESLARLEGHVDTLKAIGDRNNPANPAPVEVPTETPTETETPTVPGSEETPPTEPQPVSI